MPKPASADQIPNTAMTVAVKIVAQMLKSTAMASVSPGLCPGKRLAQPYPGPSRQNAEALINRTSLTVTRSTKNNVAAASPSMALKGAAAIDVDAAHRNRRRIIVTVLVLKE